MRYLLDTHTLLWARSAPGQLSRDALVILESADSALYLSVASLWECTIKSSIGKLDMPDDFYRIVANDYHIPGVDLPHLEAYADLPMHHTDPFDRLFVVQARLGGLTSSTRDQNIAKYDVPVVTA